MYGLKGLAAYSYHADVLGAGDERLPEFMERMLAMLNDDQVSGGQLISCALEVGNYGMLAMSWQRKWISGWERTPESWFPAMIFVIWRCFWNRHREPEWMSIPMERCWQPTAIRN